MLLDQWICVAGAWLNLACITRVRPLEKGAVVSFVDGSSELLSSKAAGDLLRAIAKKGESGNGRD